MVHRTLAFVSVLTLMLAACGSDSESDPGSGGGASGAAGSANGGTGGTGETGGTGGASTFDPNDPGIRMQFSVGVALMMGQPATFAAGAFTVTGREDLEPLPEPPKVPLETCEETTVVHTPTCAGPQDCAAEQQCVPETDMDGNPIPSSEHCATPRTPLNVGPFTIDGFATGPKTMAYNAGQNGAYTTPGGDGTVPYADLAFDKTYTFQGSGDASQGLGAFTGELHLAPEIRLTQPQMTPLPMGSNGIQVSVSQELVLQWDGSDPGTELTISLTGGSLSGESHTITCRTADAGSFTIPAAMVQAAQLGDMAFINMLTLERTSSGTVSGEGITSHDVGTLQTAIINVAKLP